MALYNSTSYTPTEAAYYADISGLDHQIGVIRQKLMDLGQYENTGEKLLCMRVPYSKQLLSRTLHCVH